MKFKTESGSWYEADTENNRVRRLSGDKDPTPRQGKDGEWRSYETISPPIVGEIVVIIWPEGTPVLPGSPEGAMPVTMTSPIVEVKDEVSVEGSG